MQQSRELFQNLRENLSAVVGNTHTQRQLNDIVRVCHALALAFVKSKLRNGKINAEFIGLKVNDIALDCVADLIQRDHDGAVAQLKVYFAGVGIDDLSEQALLAHLRRLVSSKVNQGIFRLYQEIDPGLAKILRNIKLCVKSLGNFIELERFGETYIAPSLCDPLLHSPLLELEVIEEWLRRDCTKRDHVPQLLSYLSMRMREQRSHCRLLPLVPLAIVIRSFFHDSQDTLSIVLPAESGAETDNVQLIIRSVCITMKRKFYQQYVKKKGVPSEVFDQYFFVIEKRLGQVFAGGDGEDTSLFDGLKEYMPGLGREEYLQNHKNILEYLSRLAYERTVETLKR